MSKKCIIFDLDGTLRDLRHRLHHIQGNNKNYDAFHAEVSKDAPKEDVISLFYMANGYLKNQDGEDEFEIFIFSGCSESARKDTVEWLYKEDMEDYDRLWMRPEGDYQSDVELKRSWLHKIQEEGYEVIFTVDDRQSVVDMWREEGVTCLQCCQWEEDNHDSLIDLSKAHLNVLVGPSGAGKTSFALDNVYFNTSTPEDHLKHYVCSDDIRQVLCGDFKDQSRNDEVFAIYHKDIKNHLECGRIVYADATHLRAKDRKKLLDLLPEGVEATYHIIDRPLKDKIKTGGWRNDVVIMKDKTAGKKSTLIEYHHHKFQSSVEHALDGDGDDRVAVVDHRGKL